MKFEQKPPPLPASTWGNEIITDGLKFGDRADYEFSQFHPKAKAILRSRNCWVFFQAIKIYAEVTIKSP